MAKEKEEKEVAEHKYVVEDLAEELGLTPQSTRVFLRSIEAPREGRSYGWDTKAELDSLVKQYNNKKKDTESEPAPAKAKVPNKSKRKEAA